MEQYLNQLLEDLAEAQNIEISYPDYKALYPDHPAASYGFDHIIGWELAPETPMAKVFGIANEAFPPEDRLTEQQARRLNEAILACWAAHQIFADLPEEVPSQRVVYRELRKAWHHKGIKLIKEGQTHLEFCHYEVESCPWGEDYCRCNDFEDWTQSDSKPTRPNIAPKQSPGDFDEEDHGELPF